MTHGPLALAAVTAHLAAWRGAGGLFRGGGHGGYVLRDMQEGGSEPHTRAWARRCAAEDSERIQDSGRSLDRGGAGTLSPPDRWRWTCGRGRRAADSPRQFQLGT
ncbi:hypothetical protein CU044_2837 [Streptomyces sp. L-9-10]|nr:hypothetical protein CU044_2837 [Streptomyces sp. L-9-10]